MVIMRKNIIIAFALIFAFASPSGAKSKTLASFIDKVSSSLVSFDDADIEIKRQDDRRR